MGNTMPSVAAGGFRLLAEGVQRLSEITTRGGGAVVAEPTRVEVLDDKAIASVCCGAEHSIAVARDGTMYSWGCGKNYVLGHGNCDDVWEPTVVDVLRQRLQQSRVGASRPHSAVFATPSTPSGSRRKC